MATAASVLKEEEQDSELPLFICENTDGIQDPMEQMTYALNETQVKCGSITILKNAP
jgi:dsDNA-binding SOS-regulon protein